MDILDRQFAKRTDCVTRSIAGETIVVPVRNKVGDLDSIYTVNEIGNMIWQQVDGQRKVAQIVEAVCEAYDVSASEAQRDVVEFIESLQEAGLIQAVEGTED